MRLSPEKDNKEIFSVALGAFIVAHLTSILVHSWWPEASVQLWMAVAGFASRHLIRIGMNVLGIVEAKSPAVIESAVDKGAEVLVGKIGDDK
jgi:hypothetical protein